MAMQTVCSLSAGSKGFVKVRKLHYYHNHQQCGMQRWRSETPRFSIILLIFAKCCIDIIFPNQTIAKAAHIQMHTYMCICESDSVKLMCYATWSNFLRGYTHLHVSKNTFFCNFF